MPSQVPTPVGRIIERQRRRYGRNNIVFPLDAGPQGMLFIFKEYDFNSTRGAGLLKRPAYRSTGDSIYLPLPKSLIDTTSLNLQSTQLGAVSEALGQILSGGTAAGQSGSGDLTDIIKALSSAVGEQLPGANDISNVLQGDVSALKNIESQTAFLLRKTLDSFGVARGVDVGLGSTINPKAALAFEGVTLKNHSFDWDLAVRYREESEIVKKIHYVLKKNTLPEYVAVGLEGGTGSLSRALLKYPSMVDIFLIGLDQSYYFYFKTAMVSNFSINYSGQGNVVMEGGKPGYMNLSIQLMETDIHTSEDYSTPSEEFNSQFGGGR